MRTFVRLTLVFNTVRLREKNTGVNSDCDEFRSDFRRKSSCLCFNRCVFSVESGLNHHVLEFQAENLCMSVLTCTNEQIKNILMHIYSPRPIFKVFRLNFLALTNNIHESKHERCRFSNRTVVCV